MPAPSPTPGRRVLSNRIGGRNRLRAAAALVAVLSLVACGGGEDASDRPGASSTTTVAPPPTAPPVTAPAIGTQSGRLDALPDTAVVPPVSLRIPALGIDAPVRAVGVQADGEMEVPAATDVGWYRFGPTPGAVGSAVLAAHVDYDGKRGVFFDLRQLSDGDRVEVTLADGSQLVYEVLDVEQIPKGALRDSGVFARTGAPRLALITCGGSFDADARSYRDNIVVHARPLPAAASGVGQADWSGASNASSGGRGADNARTPGGGEV